jgi:spore germination protein
MNVQTKELNVQVVRKTPLTTKLLLVVLVLCVTGLSAFSTYLYLFPLKTVTKEIEKIVYKPDTLTKTIQQIETEKINAVDKKEKDISELEMTGWIPDWDIPDGLTSLKLNKDKFASISPVWFWVNEDGTLKETAKTNDSEFIQYCKDNNIELIPAISLFDHEIFGKVLNSDENLDRHVDSIMEQVLNNNYDGIDLDYESTRLSDTNKYFEFLEKLSVELKKNNKKFIVTVLAKWGETFQYNSLRETRQLQDYKRITDLCDELRIMTYEYVSPGSYKAGPIAPVEWMEKVIKYAISVGAPREKIVLGIHTYAYDWPTDQLMTDSDVATMDINFSKFYDHEGVEPADAFYYQAISKLVSEYNLQITYNDKWQEAIGTYTFEDKPRTVVFINNDGITARKKLAADYGLKGVAFWRIGDEGDLKY